MSDINSPAYSTKYVAGLLEQLSASQAREAELREKLELMTADRDSESRWASEYKQRAEAAEARINASQEPCGWRVALNLPETLKTGWEKGLPSPETVAYWEQAGTHIEYCYPIPPELAELQRENAELRALLEESKVPVAEVIEFLGDSLFKVRIDRPTNIGEWLFVEAAPKTKEPKQ